MYGMLTLPPRGTYRRRTSVLEISKSGVPTQAYHRVKCHRRLTTTTPSPPHTHTHFVEL